MHSTGDVDRVDDLVFDGARDGGSRRAEEARAKGLFGLLVSDRCKPEDAHLVVSEGWIKRDRVEQGELVREVRVELRRELHVTRKKKAVAPRAFASRNAHGRTCDASSRESPPTT